MRLPALRRLKEGKHDRIFVELLYMICYEKVETSSRNKWSQQNRNLKLQTMKDFHESAVHLLLKKNDKVFWVQDQ